MPSGELYGLRALVTGASKGIAEAVAERLHGEGATVLTTARTAPSSAMDLNLSPAVRLDPEIRIASRENIPCGMFGHAP